MNISNNYKYFSNTQCEYYHFEYLANGVKSCMNCGIPHSEKGYDYIMSKIGDVIRKAEKTSRSEP